MKKHIDRPAEELLLKEIQMLGRTDGVNQVFTTFLELMATSLAAEMDTINREERKKRYEELEEKLDTSQIYVYGKMCMLMVRAAAENMDEPKDVLGDIYHRLKLNNQWNGQYFTPDNVSRLMAGFLNLPERIENGGLAEDEYIRANEPACGSGTMVLGMVWDMQRKNLPYWDKVFFVAQDIDIRCVWMAYIQFCLYRIPAVVVHGNTLTMEIWSYWYTPCGIRLLSSKRYRKDNEERAVEIVRGKEKRTIK